MKDSRTVVVDGHNLLHRVPALQPLIASGDFALARHRLVRLVQDVAGAWAEKIVVVFDGREGSRAEEYASNQVDVRYAPGHLTADTVIERMVSGSADPGCLLVVTSDRSVLDTVTAGGAEAMSCAAFLEGAPEHRSPRRRPPGGPTLGDYFPR